MSIIQEIKESWGWVGIKPVQVVGENDFGNLMIEGSEGKYWRLCPEDVYCEVVAKTREELDQLSTDQEFLEDWYMQALVEQAQEHLGPLKEGEKYCLVTPGALGGEYAISNIKTAPLIEMVRFSGHVAHEIKDLPDGAQIKLRVVD
ncbi:T6SS immunity protein Tdi1 domain-containing protein [uncultured Shewanella sp.]|uniref:T6SS immunity protein Tdi1 domain-containing protein n=1 Tax=uncultured Shewanella sp. TaxID=173975 RepID=UPI00260F2422|nr:T6SS immunity protein Tdi1 domain-containing protein [uncultured Shewanella sp.]